MSKLVLTASYFHMKIMCSLQKKTWGCSGFLHIFDLRSAPLLINMRGFNWIIIFLQNRYSRKVVNIIWREVSDGCSLWILSLQACVKRIQGDETGHKHCTGQYFDYWSCVDKCVSLYSSIIRRRISFSFTLHLLLKYLFCNTGGSEGLHKTEVMRKMSSCISTFKSLSEHVILFCELWMPVWFSSAVLCIFWTIETLRVIMINKKDSWALILAIQIVQCCRVFSGSAIRIIWNKLMIAIISFLSWII